MSYPDGDLGTAIPASCSQHHHHDVSTAAARRRGGATRFASGSGSPFQELGNPAPSGSRMQPVGSCVVRVPHPRRPEIPMARRAAFHRATDAWRIGLPPGAPSLSASPRSRVLDFRIRNGQKSEIQEPLTVLITAHTTIPMTAQVNTQGASLVDLKKAGTFSNVLQTLSIANVENVDGKLKCNLTDGKENVRAVITSQVRFRGGTFES